MKYCHQCQTDQKTTKERLNYQGSFAGNMCNNCWTGSWLNPDKNHISKTIKADQEKDIFMKFKEYKEDDTTVRNDTVGGRVVECSKNVPRTKEALYYREIFNLYFGAENRNVIPYFWLPKWCGDVEEPSARILDVYDSESKKIETI